MSGPYQSRLFNFLNRQAIAVNDRLGKTVRHLKVAASWGVQVLLYPFYLLVQTARWAEFQLENKFEEIKYQLPINNQESLTETESITTDEVISNVLAKVQSSLDGFIIKSFKDTNNNSLVKTEQNQTVSLVQNVPKIEAIACLLEHKSLVLVAKNNEIIDILTSEQQSKLAQLISWQITKYGIYSRNKIKKSRSSLPLITINNSHIIAPIRWFWQVMGWMQVSDVARGINLFGELRYSSYSENSLNLSRPTPKIINKLDGKIAYLERQQDRETGQLVNKNHQLIVNQEDNPFQIQVLILAAIDYFFGQKNTNKNSLKTELNQNQLTESNSELEENESDPWLSWSDLAKQKNEAIVTEIEEEKPLNLLTGKVLPQSKNNPWNGLTNLIKLFSGQTKLEKQTDETVSQMTSQNTENKKTKKSLVLSTFNNNNNHKLAKFADYDNRSSNNLEAKPEWIETDAKPIGYVKNPLEIVLQWLDKIILWVEEMVMYIVSLIEKK